MPRPAPTPTGTEWHHESSLSRRGPDERRRNGEGIDPTGCCAMALARARVAMASAIALSACSSSPSSDANGKIDSSFIAKVDQTCSTILTKWKPFGSFPYPTFNPVTPDPTVLPKVGTYSAQYLPSAAGPPRPRHSASPPGVSRWTRLRSLALQDNSVAMAQVT